LKIGVIALMGSGELTATMVEVHKELLRQYSPSPQAVFLDTPAGFQLNVDEISGRAEDYFRRHVQQTIKTASYKSRDIPLIEAEKAFTDLKNADFILIGPGSPTYAVKQWQETPVHRLLMDCIKRGGTLVAASAAALTVGRFTLPVYEIYKVGEDLHWEKGLDILAGFGINAVVIPHWNNAEGGTHDTRYCYMGEPRFIKLETLLPEETIVIGLEEHTACLLDLEKRTAEIKGIGRVIIRRRDNEDVFSRGDEFSIDELLLSKKTGTAKKSSLYFQKKERVNIMTAPSDDDQEKKGSRGHFWSSVHHAEDLIQNGLDNNQTLSVIKGLLDLDEIIWKAKKDLENEEFISQAREIFRENVVLLGIKLDNRIENKKECLAPLIEALLKLRKNLRDRNHWEEADGIRRSLQQIGVIVDDTETGWKWHLKK